MYSWTQRLNGVYAFATTVLLCVIVAVVFTTELFPRSFEANVELTSIIM
jgi:hypothetical protein